ncbi:hypothetical protein Pmani_006335 [Petrolisthes manimaculis]|uniref:Uncharacterized protein n=1 Tax=Petrolisthes manimaculis TaxID=1843537 RepID=A0AAE1UGK6_9EUCA|nr:hypothetical protein Pmani_006335 [Petrolisthes manimaculis]
MLERERIVLAAGLSFIKCAAWRGPPRGFEAVRRPASPYYGQQSHTAPHTSLNSPPSPLKIRLLYPIFGNSSKEYLALVQLSEL